MADFKNFLKDIVKIMGGLGLLLIASQGIVYTAKYFSIALGWPIGMVGILIVGVGGALPETYFAILAARRFQTWCRETFCY